MPAIEPASSQPLPRPPAPITIRQEEEGYGVRFGLSEAEDAQRPGPVFPTLDEAMAWIARIDAARGA